MRINHNLSELARKAEQACRETATNSKIVSSIIDLLCDQGAYPEQVRGLAKIMHRIAMKNEVWAEELRVINIQYK